MSEVNKYKKLIAKIKTDNDLLHKEIINLYREEKLGTYLFIQVVKSLKRSP